MCRACFSMFEEHILLAAASYCGYPVFDHTKLILKHQQSHWQGSNCTFTVASRKWWVICIDSHCNWHTVNTDGLRVEQSHWIFFEVYRQQSGKAGLAPTISRGICWLSGMWSTLPSGSAIRDANNSLRVDTPYDLC
jgi:hypothetical protein